MYEPTGCPNCDGGGCWRCSDGVVPPRDHCPRCGAQCEVWQEEPVMTIECDECREVWLMDTDWPDVCQGSEN